MKRIRITKGFVALVDDKDFEKVSDRSWFAVTSHGITYAYRGKLGFSRKNRAPWENMHRLILGLTDRETIVDHKNGNGLDNRRKNLRICTDALNGRNRTHPRKGTSSRYKGVHWRKDKKKWHAEVVLFYKKHYLGLFTSEIAAARAYDRAARRLHGRFAALNFPRSK